MNLSELEAELRAFLDTAKRTESSGLAPVAETYLKLALASLDEACGQLELAGYFQAQALAGLAR